MDFYFLMAKKEHDKYKARNKRMAEHNKISKRTKGHYQYKHGDEGRTSNGGDEDPVTGSIHSGLAPYWAKQLNKKQLMAYQASQRGGILNCQVNEDHLLISGTAVLYLKGNIFLD